MLLYIVRHGIAVDIGQNGVQRDRDRMLTPMGRTRLAAVGCGLKMLGCAPERIVASPLVRARETAEILACRLPGNVQVETANELGTQGTPEATIAWLRLRHMACGSIMLVGHMPNVSELTAQLAGGGVETDISFKKAAVACISCEGKPLAGAGTLEWLMPPKALRLLGENGD